MIKFSKTYSNIEIKEDYIKKNNQELSQIIKITKFYSKQKVRNYRKICNTKLGFPIFQSFGIPYIFCKNCNHLTGDIKIKISQIFIFRHFKKLNFGKIYLKNYAKIVKNIHNPKANFKRCC